MYIILPEMLKDAFIIFSAIVIDWFEQSQNLILQLNRIMQTLEIQQLREDAFISSFNMHLLSFSTM